VLSRYLPGGDEENHGKPVRSAGIRAETIPQDTNNITGLVEDFSSVEGGI
jgi:hypothetical protein